MTATATRTRRPAKPTTCTLVTAPVCCCELLPNGLAGEVLLNGDAYRLEINAELPGAGEPVIFGYRVTSPAGDCYDLPASLSSCDCPGHERWGAVRSPGKFEGTAGYVPYFYGQEGDIQGAYTSYLVDESDREIFPELTAGQVIWLYESDYGFVGECDEPSEEDIEESYNDY